MPRRRTTTDYRYNWIRKSAIVLARQRMEQGLPPQFSVIEFFGLRPRTLQAPGLTPRQAASRAVWAKRRSENGPNGLSKYAEQSMRLNLVAAHVAKRRQRKSRTCRNGHFFTPENTRLAVRKDGRVDRHCRACERVSWAKVFGPRRAERNKKSQAKTWKQELFEAHPDLVGGSHEAVMKVIERRDRERASAQQSLSDPVPQQPLSGADGFVLRMVERGLSQVRDIVTAWQLEQLMNSTVISYSQARATVDSAIGRLGRMRMVVSSKVQCTSSSGRKFYAAVISKAA